MKVALITPEGEQYGVPPQDALLTIVTYGTWTSLVNRSKKFGSLIEAYNGYKRVIADESHSLKPGTKKYDAIDSIPSGARIGLTGTPGDAKKKFAQLKFCGLEGWNEPRLWDEISLKSNHFDKCILDIGERSQVKLPEVKYIQLPINMGTEYEKRTYGGLLAMAKESRQLLEEKKVKVHACKNIEKLLSMSCTSAHLAHDFLMDKNIGDTQFKSWLADREGSAGKQSSKMVAINKIIQSLPTDDKFIVFSSQIKLLDIAYDSCPVTKTKLTGSVKV